MNYKARNRIRMFVVVESVFIKYATTIEQVNPLKIAVDKFNELMSLLRSIVGSDITDITGFTGKKNTLKTDLAKLTASLAKAGRAYAIGKKDESLLAIFDLAKSDIERSNDYSAIEMVTNVQKELTKILPEMTEYLVEQPDLDLLETKKSNFSKAVHGKNSQSTGKVVNTSELSVITSQLNRHLTDRMDSLIDRIQDRFPELNKEYDQARIIIDYSGGGSSKDDTKTPVETEKTPEINS